MNTDKHWQYYGKNCPYWSVVTWDEFKGDIASDGELLDRFFFTGQEYVRNILSVVKSVNPEFKPSTLLDFGCGVGRLLVPFAETGLSVSGVDISEDMLRIAEGNLSSRGLKCGQLVRALDDLPAEGKYDLVHSYIVLQHIPVNRGYAIIRQLLDRVSRQGIAVLHVTYASERISAKWLWPSIRNLLLNVIVRVGLLGRIYRTLKGKIANPPMLIGKYSLNKLFAMLNQERFNNLHVCHTIHGDNMGIIIIAQRHGASQYDERF